MMSELKLEELFTPRLLEAFRRSWGHEPANARRVLEEVLGIFEEGKGMGLRTHARRQAFLRTLSTALVGEEPHFHAWLEAFAVGNFDLPDEVMYGRAPDKGSPSRFLERQRKKIEELIDPAASPQEQELQRRAYMDAIRLMLSSLLARELGRGIAAKAAIGTGWPIMVAADRLKAREKKLLHHFGGDNEFLDYLAARIAEALQGWIDEHLGGRPPVLGRSRAYVYSLPPGMDVHDALTYLDRGDIAIDHYRASLWAELKAGEPPAAITGTGRTASAVATVDAETIRHLINKVEGHKSNSRRLGPGGEWAYFREARPEENPFEYTADAVENLRLNLPILREEAPAQELLGYARFRADRRRVLRKDAPGSQTDEAVQAEIAEWVDRGHPPPAGLRAEHAGYHEEEVCRRAYQIKRDHRWEAAGLYPPGSETADLPF